jgi:hypothetical protein
MSFQYKDGQVPFVEADKDKSFEELLGDVNSTTVLPRKGKYETPTKTRAFLGLKRIVQKYWRMDAHNFLICELYETTINHLLSYQTFGPKSVEVIYEMYAEHAVPIKSPDVEQFNLNSSETGELINQIDAYETPVVFESYIKKAHDFCVFTLNGEIYIKFFGLLIPFTSIVQFDELESNEELVHNLRLEITFITRIDCEVQGEQYKKDDPAIIHIEEYEINQVETQKLIQIFNTFNPS